MDCYNHSCQFRVNETSNANRCECVACQNRNPLLNCYQRKDDDSMHKPCYGKCPRCVWRLNGGCSEWQ